jgi:hypothetical protein
MERGKQRRSKQRKEKIYGGGIKNTRMVMRENTVKCEE